MKNLFVNILIKVIALLYWLFVVAWVGIATPLIIVSGIVKILLCYYDFDNDEVSCNEIADKITTWAVDFLILPYKWLGVANNFKEFAEYVSFHL